METKLKIGDKFTQTNVIDGIIHKVEKIIITADSIRYVSDYSEGVTFEESEIQKYEEPKPKKLYAFMSIYGEIKFKGSEDDYYEIRESSADGRFGCAYKLERVPQYDILFPSRYDDE